MRSIIKCTHALCKKNTARTPRTEVRGVLAVFFFISLNYAIISLNFYEDLANFASFLN